MRHRRSLVVDGRSLHRAAPAGVPQRGARPLGSRERSDGPAANDAVPERLQSRLMRIGIPREIKDGERRVGMTPDGARALAHDGRSLGTRRIGEPRADQGGIAETSRVTTRSNPTYVEEGVVHYAAPNLPALVPRTATTAFCAARLGHVRAVAGRGLAAALDQDPGLAEGVMVWDGAIVHAGLAAQAKLPVTAVPWRKARAQPARVG
jgi:Alanine dehydrogenase/PNT, C-terminal domain